MSFKDWFKNSKVVDSNGKPLVVYHGSPIKFDTFNPDLMNYGSISHGFCFFTNKKSAYPNCAKDYAGKDGYVYECYLRIEKPLHLHYRNTPEEYYHTPIHFWDTCQSDIRREFRKGDYDGIIIENEDKNVDDSVIYLVPNANQIKSVDAKLFSNSDNIYEKLNEELEQILEQKAYHGTNVEFDTFDMDKIQEYKYGYGIYFTHSKLYASDFGNIIKEFEIPDYEVLMDWDAPFNSQPEKVQVALHSIWQATRDLDKDKKLEKAIFDFNSSGAWIYYSISEFFNYSSKEVSEYLYKFGIKGTESLRYNCIVIFNSKDIKKIT